ncbi:PAS domain-containing protein [Erythrobacter sp. NE805]|uniref:PAS domain-containing protein n=1 Tax=Erythrobacter sp. NE805 TaxID=3389875 RepID=UPI00396B3166
MPFRHTAAAPSPTEGEPSPDSLSPEASLGYRGLAEPAGFLSHRTTWTSYGLAVALTGAVVVLRRWLDSYSEGIVPFAVFFPAVLVCTLFGGVGPGVLSLALAAAAATFFWLEPIGSLTLTGPSFVSLLLFVLSNAVNIYVADRLRKAHDRLRQSEARLSLSQDVGRIGIWDLDLRTGALWWSRSFHEVTGIAVTEPPSIEGVMRRIHPADHARAVQALDDARRGNDRLDIEFRFNRDDGATIWLAGRAELFRDAQGRPTRLLGINFDATPIRTAESERDRANALLRTFFESLPGAAFAKDVEGRYLLGNPIFAAAVGHTEESFAGRTDLELLADKEQARALMANDRAVMEGGKARQLEEGLLLPNGEMSYWLGVKAPFFDADGQPQGIMGISLDVTDRRKAEERLRFLADEVDHRAKNLLGVVLSLVRLTKVDDVKAFKAAVSGRIEALARAHALLAANRWQGVHVDTLLREEIAPFGRVGSERIQLAGPSVLLEPNAAQALAMAVHELAINAAMYGALSVESGCLSVAWEIEGSDALVLEWRETGGPEVAPPAAPGFGSTAIRGAIEHQLSGTFDLTWAPSGLTCRIAFPLAGNAAPGPGTADPASSGEREATRPAAAKVELAGKRVLVVEDEALIALTLVDALREMGCEVAGPASTVAAALELARADRPDLAVLDVNLAGTGSAPVAQALRSEGVPYVYCTGYAEPALQIAPELRAAMLTKPIDPAALESALRVALADAPEPCSAP